MRSTVLLDVRVIEAVEAAIDFQVQCMAGTEIKYVQNPDSEKLRILSLVSDARRALEDDK